MVDEVKDNTTLEGQTRECTSENFLLMYQGIRDLSPAIERGERARERETRRQRQKDKEEGDKSDGHTLTPKP